MTTKTPEPAKQAVNDPQNLKQNLTELLEHHVQEQKTE